MFILCHLNLLAVDYGDDVDADAAELSLIQADDNLSLLIVSKDVLLFKMLFSSQKIVALLP